MARKKPVEHPPSPAAYERWLRHVFDRPVTEPAWWWGEAATDWNESARPAVTVTYLTRLFEDPAPLIGRWSPDQIGQGLWFLCDSSCSNHLHHVAQEGVAWPERRRCIEAIPSLYARLFAALCKPELSHLQRADDDAAEGGGRKANSVCYMFWDIAPLNGHREARFREQDEACLGAMRATLRVGHVACQEGALHGLGHFEMYHPKRVAEIVDEFLAAHPRLTPELRHYAMMARRPRAVKSAPVR